VNAHTSGAAATTWPRTRGRRRGCRPRVAGWSSWSRRAQRLTVGDERVGVAVRVRAENRGTVSYQRLCGQTPTDLAARRPSPHSMIDHCGPPTRLPHARTHVELACAARPVRRGQGRRDLGAAARGRGAAPNQSAPDADVDRPGVHHRIGQAAAHPAPPAPAGLTANAAAMACPARSPPLDLPATTTGPTILGRHPIKSRSLGCRWPDARRERPVGPTRRGWDRPRPPPWHCRRLVPVR
jgi:hypothetical protein